MRRMTPKLRIGSGVYWWYGLTGAYWSFESIHREGESGALLLGMVLSDSDAVIGTECVRSVRHYARILFA